jgi:hypothetical protein
MSYKSTSLHLYVGKTPDSLSAFKVSSNSTETTTTLDALNSYKLQLKSSSDVVLSTTDVAGRIMLKKETLSPIEIDLIDQIEKQNALITIFQQQIEELQTVINNITADHTFATYNPTTADQVANLHTSS